MPSIPQTPRHKPYINTLDTPAQGCYTKVERVGMRFRILDKGGFTLLEVTFATGISLLAFGMLLGSIFSLVMVRDTTHRRLQTVAYLQQCLEQVQALSVREALEYQPQVLASAGGVLKAQVEFLDPAGTPLSPASIPPEHTHLAVRVTVITHTARGHRLQSSAVRLLGGAADAP